MNHNEQKPKFYQKMTWLQHGGSDYRLGSGVIGAMEQAVTFKSEPEQRTPIYARMGNTINHTELHSLLAGLYMAEKAVSFGSGMAALSAIFLTYLQPGDHCIILENCYGTTQSFFRKLASRWQISFDFAPIDQWEKFLKPNTKLVHLESISNPFCLPQDIRKAAEFARKHKLISICDNTFASPYNCNPLELGCNLVVESGTKYLNGHSDVTCGVVAGSSEFMERITDTAIILGGFLPIRELSLWLRGLRTFAVRMKQHNENGQKFASAMQERPYIKQVWYGADEQNIRSQFFCGFGGMCALRFAPHINLEQSLPRLQYAHNAPSLGGTETTICIPYHTTHYAMTVDQKKQLDVCESLLRVSVGLECVEDLVADFDQAFL